jgi:hypothetical protein
MPLGTIEQRAKAGISTTEKVRLGWTPSAVRVDDFELREDVQGKPSVLARDRSRVTKISPRHGRM